MYADPDPAFWTNADPDTDPVRIWILVKFEQSFPKANKKKNFSPIKLF
jgi:hypothetical protein